MPLGVAVPKTESKSAEPSRSNIRARRNRQIGRSMPRNSIRPITPRHRMPSISTKWPNQTCDTCGASWVGPAGIECEWCERRFALKRESDRKRLLWPEWLGWADRYFDLSPIDQTVWEHTRGFVGDYRSKWQRDIHRAVIEGLVTDAERAGALRRVTQWMIRLQKPAS